MHQEVWDRIRAQMAIEDARNTINMAKFRCMSFDQLLDNLYDLISSGESPAAIYAISEIDRTREQNQALALSLQALFRKVDCTKGVNKERLDRQIGRLLRILPTDLSQPIALNCISHSRKSRRTAGLRCLDLNTLDDETSRYLVDCFDRTSDNRIAKSLLKHPLQLRTIEPTRLIAVFESDQYWQMRVVEATLRADQSIGLSFADTHPAAFVWAAGRLGEAQFLPTITHCFDVTNDKLSLIGIVAWAYGKLGAISELRNLRDVLDELEATHSYSADKS